MDSPERLLAATAAAAVAVLLLAWTSYRRAILRKTDQLVAMVRRFGDGDWSARSSIPYGSGEFSLLARALDEIAETVQKREQEIAWRRFAVDQHAIVSMTDAEGNIIFVNDKFCGISGYSQDELLGKNHRLLNSGLHPRAFFEDMWQTISSGKVWQGVIRNLHKQGGYYWVTSTVVPRLDNTGIPVCYFSLRTDVTGLIQVEEALKRSEEMYRLLAENAQDVVALHSKACVLEYVSPACERMLGYNPRDLMAANLWTLVHEKDRETVMKKLVEPIRDGAARAAAVCRIRHGNGSIIWVEINATHIHDAEGRLTHVQSTLRDITLRKEAEDQLRLHDLAIQSSLTGIMLFSSDHGNPVVYVNPAFEAITALRKEDIECRNVQCLFDRVENDGNFARLRASLDAGMEGRTLIRFTRRDGTARWADCAIAPVRGDDGNVTHFVLALSDMAERMLALEDMRRAKEESDRANRAKSEFLSRVTHELRTPLNFMLGFAQLLEAQPGQLSETQLDGVKRIIQSGWHLRELIDEMLDLSRIEAGKLDIQLDDVEVAPLVAECIGIVELMSAERGIRIACKGAPAGAGRVRADRMRLKQVLLNLLSNAIKFNRDGGVVTVEHALAAPGVLRITVADTGPGIDLTRQGELFQPFSRLDADRSEIPGTGIGLAVSHRFVQLMEGRIGVHSERGQGSAFWVELPESPDADLLA